MFTRMPDDEEFEDAIFKDLQYIEGSLSDKTFKKCTFKHCNFFQCIFENCTFQNCTFENCDLSLIKFVKSHFNELTFRECKAIGVDWTDKYNFKVHLKFEKCTINYCVFMGLTLKDFVLTQSTALEVDFSDAKMLKANCTQTDFTDTVFNRTNLKEADFTEAINYTINPKTNTITKAKFSMPEVLRLLSDFNITIVT